MNIATKNKCFVRLHVDESVQIHKVHVNVNDDVPTTHPLMSLRKLKNDYMDASSESFTSTSASMEDMNSGNICQLFYCLILFLLI